MTNSAPICLFVYKRVNHTRRTIEALQRNELAPDTDLLIFSDGPKDDADTSEVFAVRDLCAGIKGFKSVTLCQREVNLGLSKSIINGVSGVLQRYNSTIVVEDDLITSPLFLSYMNAGLELYENDTNVVSISGYNYPVSRSMPDTFFLRGADCWGWGTWRRGWDVFNPDGSFLLRQLEQRGLCYEFDFYGTSSYTQMLRDQIAARNDSWAIRWYASAFLAEKLTLYPGASLVQNIGFDGSGTHCDAASHPALELGERRVNVARLEIEECTASRRAIADSFHMLATGSGQERQSRFSWLWRMARRIKRRC